MTEIHGHAPNFISKSNFNFSFKTKLLFAARLVDFPVPSQGAKEGTYETEVPSNLINQSSRKWKLTIIIGTA